jgi:transcriptional regulator with XRE-family HTH domain
MDGHEIKGVLGKNIKFFRFRNEFSQADLAEKINISITFLSNIERGLKFPKPDILAKIADGLSINVFELFKTDIIHEENKELIKRLSEDMKSKVNHAMQEVFNQYSK